MTLTTKPHRTPPPKIVHPGTLPFLVAALAFMGEMKQTMACDESTFSTVVHSCAQTRDWPAAERVLTEMREAGLKPNDACYYALISAASKAGELALAEKLLKSMRGDGMPPDQYAFTTIFAGCASFSNWRMAMRLLESMEIDGILPTRQIFNAALRACGCGEAEVASVLLEMMRRQGIEADTFGCVSAMIAFGRGGRMDKVLALMDDMRQREMPPNRELLFGGLRWYRVAAADHHAVLLYAYWRVLFHGSCKYDFGEMYRTYGAEAL